MGWNPVGELRFYMPCDQKKQNIKSRSNTATNSTKTLEVVYILKTLKKFFMKPKKKSNLNPY